tara:strand:- start:7109 stop:7510 length:402 start_codon:yes stop_codon:yes gene_type:complete
MATEILINDGGAPARILPFIAGEAIAAGDALAVGNDGEIIQAQTTHAHGAGHIEYMIGVALTSAASGEPCNVVSGKGIIVNCNVEDVTEGKGLKVGTTTAGRLAPSIVLGHTCAVCLEDTGTVGLHKIMIIGG